MPCHPARSRELLASGRAIRRFDRGLFHIRLTDRADGKTQPVAVGIDPGSKKEAFSVKSEAHTYLNIQTDAVTWVSKSVETRRQMRQGRRARKTPYRKCRPNRGVKNRIPPSTKARWGWKLRICNWLFRYYPITVFVVEDIKAKSRKSQRRWNRSFSPLQVGKRWFYRELGRLAEVKTYSGYETKTLRDICGLEKIWDKMSDRFGAHCVDSWVLANAETGMRSCPDNIEIMYVVPLRFHRRRLHCLQPKKHGKRRIYGGTISLGFKRGTWVRHPKYGVTYIGGCMNGRVSLHGLQDGKRLCQNAKPSDCMMLTRCSWRVRKGNTSNRKEMRGSLSTSTRPVVCGIPAHI